MSVHRHTVPLRYGRPEFESRLNDLYQSLPLSLSFTLFPISSDLSYHNKGKHDKNKSLKKIIIITRKTQSPANVAYVCQWICILASQYITNPSNKKNVDKPTSHSLFNVSAVCSNLNSHLCSQHQGAYSTHAQVKPEQHTLLSKLIYTLPV